MSLPLIERQDGERVSLHQIRLSRRAVVPPHAPACALTWLDLVVEGVDVEEDVHGWLPSLTAMWA